MESAAGCSSGYRGYIIGMDQYIKAYLEAIKQDQEYSCGYEKEYCDCICADENAGDGFNEEIYEYNCYMAKGMDYYIDKHPYNDNEDLMAGESFEQLPSCNDDLYYLDVFHTLDLSR